MLESSPIKMPDSTETTESFPSLPASENVAGSGLIANAELTAGPEAEPAPVPESAEGMWAAIRESLRGSHRDYTVGPIGRAVILLAIPMVLEMFMESLFAVADIFWVSHLGPEAAATVGLTESLLTLVYALAIGQINQVVRHATPRRERDLCRSDLYALINQIGRAHV